MASSPTNEGWHELPAARPLDMLSGKRAMGYYDQTDLPFYYWLANEFAIADHYHCSLLGPTWPNRMYLYAASSFGITDQPLPAGADHDALRLPRAARGRPGRSTRRHRRLRDLRWTQFLKYRNAPPGRSRSTSPTPRPATLPQVAFVDPDLGAEDYDQNDEHPPAIAQIGQEFVATVVDAAHQEPALVDARRCSSPTTSTAGSSITSCRRRRAPPTTTRRELGPATRPAKFDRYGIRVPMMVVSPFAKKHFVGAPRPTTTRRSSRFIEARFVMPALTGRDANAEAPWEMFDFEGAPHAMPPTITMPTVDQAKVDACAEDLQSVGLALAAVVALGCSRGDPGRPRERARARARAEPARLRLRVSRR